MAYLSIITPAYNSSQCIAKCITSVLEQKVEDIEHIIVDGLSTDNTIDIVRSFQNKASSLRYISEKDSGIYNAMNKGIAMAKGKWIFFLGSDDYFYSSNVLSNIIHHLKINEKQYHILYGDVYNEKEKRLFDGLFSIEKILTHNICHQAIFYQKKVFELAGLYEEIYRIQADYRLNLKCWLNGVVNHLYVPVTVSYYADGGVSSATTDERLITDYPYLCCSEIQSGNWSTTKKVQLLAILYRKVLQRYRLSVFIRLLFYKKHIFLKLITCGYFVFDTFVHLLKSADKKDK